MRPILLEIVTKVITTFDHCRHCEVLFGEAGLDQKFHKKEMEEYPPDLKEDYIKLFDWIRELTRLYQHRLLIKVIDVQSPLGIYKSLRYRIRTYPTFIIEGKEIYSGWERLKLENLLDKYIKISLMTKRQSLQPGLSKTE